MRFEKSVHDNDFVKNFFNKDKEKIPQIERAPLPTAFRIVLIVLTCLISLLLMLKVAMALTGASVYGKHIGIAVDITLALLTPLGALYLHQLIRARMARQVQEYKTLFIENPHAMWVYDINTLKFLMVNDAAVALYGYTAEEFLTMRITDIRPIEDVPALLETIDKNHKSSKPYHWSGTWRHKTKNGAEIYAEVSSYDTMFNDRPAAIALSYDVTQKVLQELKILTVNQELEQKVKERTHDLLLSNKTLVNQNNIIKKANQELADVSEALKVANEKLKVATESKSQFVSMVSHEFRSPLSTIRFAAEFVRRNHDTLTKEQLLDKTRSISKTINHMEALLNDVLTIQKSESPKIKPNMKELNIEAFIEGIVQEVREATMNSHEIIVDIEALPENIQSDEKLLRNIFLNLLTNAIKYSGSSRVVDLRAWSDIGSITFEVRDHGIGIASDHLQKIFEPFYRTPEVNSIQGTGLGLSIVKKAVEGINGMISVESQPGEGSTFTVTFPIIQEHVTATNYIKILNL